jgi:ABC-type lipoprotein export system ATPase subunit
MTLLSVERVSKRYRRGQREFVALSDVSLAIESGELAVVLGTRRSGRSTLLRIAAGIERPDRGEVFFQGRSLARDSHTLGRSLCYCHTSFSALQGDRILDHVATPLLARGESRAAARHVAERALALAEVGHCANMAPDELDGPERVRVAIARGLAPGPELLVVDDPTTSAGVMQRDPLLRLLRSFAHGEGPAVLMSTDDAMCVSGADRVLELEDGKLRHDVQAPQAEVVQLDARRVGA